MDNAHLQELIRLEQSYWWHLAKRQVVASALTRWCPAPGTLIEGGVGGGGNLRTWRDMGYAVSGFDILPESVAHCRDELGLAVQAHDLAEPWPVPAETADVIVLLDVLEHLKDPTLGLRHAAAALAPTGSLIVTVPAIAALMGPWDEMLGHHRRYTAGLLKSQANDAGLRVKWLSHWNSFCLPAAVPMRLVERLRGATHSPEFPRTSPFLNSTLLALASAERKLMRAMPFPLGLSMIGVFSR